MKTTVWHEQSDLTGRYSVRYYDPHTGKKVRVLCETYAEMKTEKHRVQTMLLNHRAGRGDPDASPLSVFGEYLQALASTHRASTLELKKFALSSYLVTVPTMAGMTKEAIEAWRAAMAKKYAPDTVSIRLRELRAFLNWCVKNKKMSESPFAGIAIAPGGFVGRRLSMAELQALVSACDPVFLPYFVLLVETGARRGELLTMEWSEVDLNNRGWYIPKAKCKTKQARTIPLSDDAEGALRSILGPRKPQEALGLVFNGWTPFKVKYHWKRALKTAGIQGRVRIHDIRHTFASNFRGRWASLKAICGWKTDVMASHYTHTDFEELKADREQFGVHLGVNLGQQTPNTPEKR